jgi:hypothetical protein
LQKEIFFIIYVDGSFEQKCAKGKTRRWRITQRWDKSESVYPNRTSLLSVRAYIHVLFVTFAAVLAERERSTGRLVGLAPRERAATSMGQDRGWGCGPALDNV